jgi:hypothetical protein
MLKLTLAALLAVAATVHSAPLGMITFFDGYICPPDWAPLPETQGRLIVSVAHASQAGITVNTPLGDREDREHVHDTTVSATLASRDISGAGGDNHEGAANGPISSRFNTQTHSSGLPFQQMLLCMHAKNTSAKVSLGTVAFFDPSRSACPAGWSPSHAYSGRILTPGFNEGGSISNDAPALAPGEDRQHAHYNLKVDVQAPTDVSYVGIGGCCNSAPSPFESQISLSGSTKNSSSGLPYITLLTCVSQHMTLELDLPSTALTFQQVKCPSGWSLSDDRAGRLPVSLPNGAVPGAQFGGPSLSPTSRREPDHFHGVSANVTIPSCGIELGSGCCASGYLGAGNFPLVGTTTDARVSMPYTMLSFCRNNAGKDAAEQQGQKKELELEKPPVLGAMRRK